MGKFIDVETYDFSELDGNIKLVENDMSGLNAEQQDPKVLATAHKWITRRGYILSICWGFGAAIVITVLPIAESQDEIDMVIDVVCCKKGEEEEELKTVDVAEQPVKEVEPADEEEEVDA